MRRGKCRLKCAGDAVDIIVDALLVRISRGIRWYMLAGCVRHTMPIFCFELRQVAQTRHGVLYPLPVSPQMIAVVYPCAPRDPQRLCSESGVPESCDHFLGERQRVYFLALYSVFR